MGSRRVWSPAVRHRRWVRGWLAGALAAGLACVTPPEPPRSPSAQQIATGLGILRACAAELDRLDAERAALGERGGWRERGYFAPDESDAIEWLYFRYLACHTALMDWVEASGGSRARFTADANGAKAHVLMFGAGLELAAHDSSWAAAFVEDPVATARLNEAFYRSEIPRGSYDRLLLHVTAEERTERLEAAWQLHERELGQPNALSRLAAADPQYRALLERMPALHAGARARIAQVRAARGTALERDLDHSRVDRLLEAGETEFGDLAYAARAHLFLGVSRLKDPRAQVIVFSPEQRRQIFGLLETGDVILTYTAGYMSDVFIPGRFKHGITYVGSPAARRRAGLRVDSLPRVAAPERERFERQLQQASLADGSPADVIEAVGEGVILNSIGRHMDDHINRLLVLRPRIDAEERRDFLAGVFAYLGDGYDFRFDFRDASEQVCTEVIYRALDGKGGIAFELRERVGRPTLSADDIVSYHLASDPMRFDLVLLAEEDPDGRDHAARILTGAAGARRLVQLMADAGDS